MLSDDEEKRTIRVGIWISRSKYGVDLHSASCPGFYVGEMKRVSEDAVAEHRNAKKKKKKDDTLTRGGTRGYSLGCVVRWDVADEGGWSDYCGGVRREQRLPLHILGKCPD